MLFVEECVFSRKLFCDRYSIVIYCDVLCNYVIIYRLATEKKRESFKQAVRAYTTPALGGCKKHKVCKSADFGKQKTSPNCKVTLYITISSQYPQVSLPGPAHTTKNKLRKTNKKNCRQRCLVKMSLSGWNNLYRALRTRTSTLGREPCRRP